MCPTVKHGVSLAICLVLLAYLAIIVESKEESQRDFILKYNNTVPFSSDEKTPVPDESDEFLVGEDTPVWIARAGHIYEKLRPGIVKKALDHFAEKLNVELRKDEHSITEMNKFISMLLAGTMDKLTNSTKVKGYLETLKKIKILAAEQSESTINVVHPTILVVMDYKTLLKKFFSTDFNMVEKYIIYALAFWNNVNIRLRSIENPRVSLRIGGIVISDNSGSEEYGPFPYMDPAGHRLSGELQPMYAYWRYNMSKNNDFPTNSYDIVVHMADFYGYGLMTRTGVSAWSPSLCLPEDYWNNIKVWEHMLFRGIESATHEMRIVLGDPVKNEGLSDHWWNIWPKMSESSKNDIEATLRKSPCFVKPKEYHPPGNPIPQEKIPLPGQLILVKEQCTGIGYPILSWSSDFSPMPRNCRDILCGYSYLWNPMHLGEALDGTACSRIGLEPAMCLEGQCIPNKWNLI